MFNEAEEQVRNDLINAIQKYMDCFGDIEIIENIDTEVWISDVLEYI